MMAPEDYQEYQKEVEQVKSIVGKHFSVYDVKVTPEVISLYCRTFEQDIFDKFEALRLEMKAAHYIPMLVYKGGEYIVHVQKKPRVKYRSPKLNLILLIATIFSTAFAGMWNWSSYAGIPWNMESLAMGSLFFALPLLLILGIHELGHYYVARKHKVDASLPFFIPLPISIIGTLGAVISMREPIPNRKALLDIGAAGPIAGLAVAIPIAVIGWYLTGAVAQPMPTNVGDEGALLLQFPLIYQGIAYFMPISEGLALHPMAFAGWVGIFVTALNLLPAGQLDGGHIARAALGDKARYVSYGALIFLIFAGLYFYMGWIIIGLLIIFLGARHPPPLNDVSKLGNKRKLLSVGMVLIIVVSFHYQPFEPVLPDHDFEFRDAIDPDLIITEANINTGPNSTYNYTFVVNNSGNTYANISLKMNENTLQNLRNDDWNFSFAKFNGTDVEYKDVIYVLLNQNESTNVTIRMVVPSVEIGDTYSIDVEAKMEKLPINVQKKLVMNIEI